MSDYENTEQTVNLKTIIDFIWKSLLKFWWFPLELALIFGAFYWVRAHKSFHAVYQTSAIYMVESKTDAYSSVYRNATTTAQVVNSFSYILNSTSLKSLVQEDLGENYEPVNVSASSLGSTNMMTLTASGSDPVVVYQTLNSMVKHFPEAAERIVGAVSFKVVDVPMIPDEPSNSSGEMAQAKKGGLLGGILGLAFILAYALTRNTILSTDAVARRTSLECLGQVEQIRFKKREKAETPPILFTEKRMSYGFKESYRSIRTRLLNYCEERHAHVILVSSTFPGEGKTTSAVNLALSIADSGYSVALVDCDLRKPSVYQTMGIERGKNDLLDVLNGTASVEKALQRFQATHLKVIAANQGAEDAAELVDSRAMADLLTELRQKMDFVILDSPPVDLLTDAVALANLADGVVFVIRHNYGKLSSVLRGVETMYESGKPIFGYIFNGVEHSFVDTVYRYGSTGSYGYGKYGKYGKYGSYGYGSKNKAE